LEDGKEVSVEISTLDGKIETRFNVKRGGNVIRIERQGALKAWNVFLVGIDAVENRGDAEVIHGSVAIKGNSETDKLTIRLR
jgi:hypothetical protein